MSDIDLEALGAALNADYDAAQAAFLKVKDKPGDDPKRIEAVAAFDAAQLALASARQHWRGIGESVDRGHEGARAGFQPKITNNDGSAK